MWKLKMKLMVLQIMKTLQDCWNVDQVFYLCKNTIFTIEGFLFTYSSYIEVYIYLMQKYLS